MASPEKPPSANLERNDVEGALAVYRWYRERERRIPHETARTLIMLQDDGEGFIEKLHQLAREIPLPR